MGLRRLARQVVRPKSDSVGKHVNGSRQLIAIFLVVAAASLALVGDLFAKLLAVSYGAIFICFGRYLAGGAFGLGVLILSQRFRLPPLTDMPGQFLRAAIAACSIICLIGALMHAPLADVMAGFYLAPVISTGLSATLLGERLGLVKSIGTGLALFGAIAILDQTGAFNLGGALAILSGVLFAFYLIAAKMASEAEDPPSAAVIQSLMAAVCTAPLALSGDAIPLSWPTIGLFVLIGMISTICQAATLIAHRWAAASTLAPFFYAALVSSVGLGTVVLNETPTPAGLLGIMAIASGGVLVALADLKRPELPIINRTTRTA